MSTPTLYRQCVPALALLAGLAGCSGQPTPAAGGFVPNAAGPQSLAPLQSARTDGGVSPLHAFRMYTANRNNASVVAFRASASGDVSPVVKLSGPNTKLVDPDALAVDASGNIYTANDGGTQVVVFGSKANGNAKPKRIIGGSKSKLGPTEGLLVDPSGDLWASDYSNNAVTEYSPSAKGNVPPIDILSGSNTQLNTPVGMAMNANGQLFVANADSGSIVVFAAGAQDNATPLGVISGSNTGLSRPFALAFDNQGRLLVADEQSGLLVFAKGALGNVAPVQRIDGFSSADGVMSDAHGHIYVADFSLNSISEYAHTASGYAQPLRTIEGSYTTLNGPNYLALH